MALQAVISEFYAAAAGRVSWEQPLDALAAHLDLWCTQIVGVDKRSGRLLFNAYAGAITPAAMLDYVRQYHTINPRLELVMRTPDDRWMHCHEHLDDQFVAHNRFYQDFLIPHGGRYMSATKLADNDEVAFMLGLFRGANREPLATGRVESEELAAIKHHLSEAIQNYLHLRLTYAELGMARHLLGQFAYPMLLVDDARGIWHRNEAALRLLQSGAVLRERAGLLTCAEPQGDEALAEALRSLGLDRRHQTVSSTRRALKLQGVDGRSHLALLSAVLPEQSGGAFGTNPLGLIIVHEPGERRAPDPLIIGDCFDLTPAEARVVARLAAGDDAKAIARRHGTALETVRTQIQRAMEKAGVNRQIDLVRMVLDLP